ncbi:probable proline--tRNA ligase, mitochondrial isoform X1 [Onthophagus taurus]|uniref:probable proline--tRNA ligase, mitochondrial isoform X1 n=1 Tax=Onthophagus taurus TaxID=166361 RepID=UPI0039BE44CD
MLTDNLKIKMNRLSRIFQPINVIPKNVQVKSQDMTSKSQKLMLDLGIIRQANSGCFHYLPLGIRALEKLKNLIDQHMQSIGAQKVACPTLIHTNLWERSGRIQEATPELFQIKDRHDHLYILSPTHEEAITDLLTTVSPLSYKHFPLRLYQITSKYRDEMKPRFGLIRSRQFLMKDLYTFDVDLDAAKETYELICKCYNQIFELVGVEFFKVLGSSGDIGGILSHEFHFQTDIGEDKLIKCGNCGYMGNLELCGNKDKCLKCGSTKINVFNGIEVGHTFLLGDKYSKPMKATYLNNNGKPNILQMGCYGLGISRILAASLEKLSTDQELRWPIKLAPFKILIIPPKFGSKEEKSSSISIENLSKNLEDIATLKNDVLIDDRVQMTIGRRFLEAKQVGYPFIVVLGQKITENPPLFELNNLIEGKQHFLTENELISYLKQKC